jgi:iron complex transport system ATP-binding protein
MLRVAVTVTEFESSWANAAGTDKISRKKGKRFTMNAVYSPFMPDQPALLDFQHISVMRGQKTVLDDITLRIQAGEHVAILGPNGSGKSTLIKVITRECYPLARPDSSLTILGRDSWNVFELRPLLGVVSNDLMSTCTRDITGLEAVLSGFFSSIGIQPYHHVTPAMRKKAEEVLDLLEVPHLADRFMDEISSGEARRILIGRALVHDPLALLLDEPSNSLDLHATLELREFVRKLAQAGTGILLVTHHLPDIIPEIDRVILLQKGRIFADGDKQQLLSAERLTQLFGLPVELARRDGYYHLW